jgi:glucose repression regulatory protein TUP1
VESKKICHTLTGHKDDIYSLDFASDSRVLATGSADCTVRLWDTEAGSQMLCLTTDDSTIASVAISPDISFVAAGSYDNSILVWSIATGLLVEHLKGQDGHTGPVNSVAFSPNGEGLVSGSLDKTVKMWELDTSRGNHLTLGPEGGKCYGTFKDHGVSQQKHD